MLAVWCSRAQSSGASKRVARWSSAKETCDLPAGIPLPHRPGEPLTKEHRAKLGAVPP